jgi:hypothetical protein
MPQKLPGVRMVVTGYDQQGKSIFESDEVVEARSNPTRPSMWAYRPWATGAIPCPVDEPNQAGKVHGIMPPENGSVLNIIDYPPEPTDPAERKKALADIAERVKKAGPHSEKGVRRSPDSPHPGMHETDSIDYAIVLHGEIYAIMDKGEKLLKTGDVLMQRGTPHAWSNRSGDYCRVAFVLVQAKR